ncbi:hypothetical protein [Pectobacterium parmentieri]|uniref:hypothetical protein n=1 Tax=Pectobacterium parmentieri TaxID=1905730 RepID=UPI001E4180A0|nr:hypothetical protein [Pectobacterium parmentieri]
MANLSENPQWVDGIYQIETSDPVVGGPDGVSNRQAKELASRTRYLKKEQEKTGSDLATHAAAADPHTQYAPKANPTFTGTPKAPTPAIDSNSQQVATTAFVKSVGATKLAKDQNGADIPNPELFRSNIGLSGFDRISIRLGTVDTEKYFNSNTPNGFYVVGGDPAALKIPLSDAFLNWQVFHGGDASSEYGVLTILGFFNPQRGQYRQFYKILKDGVWQPAIELFNDSCRIINGEVSAPANPFKGIGFYNGDFGNWPSNFGVVLQSYFKSGGSISLMQESVADVSTQYRLFGRNVVVRENGNAEYGNPVEFYHTDFKPSYADIGALAANGTAQAATKLAIPRTINGVPFDGSANIALTPANLGLGETVDLAAGALEKAKNGADIPDRELFNRNMGSGRAYSAAIDIGGVEGEWMTADFIGWLRERGAFSHPYWVCRGSWTYAGNRTITDTGCGHINLTGAVVEVFGNDGNHTLRVTTPSTAPRSDHYENSQFTYVFNGTDYFPGWRRDYNTQHKPTAADIGAVKNAEPLVILASQLPARWSENQEVGSLSLENGKWLSYISVRHRAGVGDDSNQYGFVIFDDDMAMPSNDFYIQKQYAGEWREPVKLYHSANLSPSTIGAITKVDADNNYVRQGSSGVVYKNDDLAWNSPTGAYLKTNEGYSSLIWHIGMNTGSASSAQFYFDYANGGLKYRSSRDDYGFEKPWARIYSDQDKPTAADIGALPASGVAIAATKLETARKINGVIFDGTADISIASGWNKIASGSVNYPLVNSQTKSFVGTIDTGVATTSWIHDLKKYAVVLSSGGVEIKTSNPNNCSWGASAELRSVTRFYGNSTILIDVFTYGQSLQSGAISKWELWEVI